MSPVVATTITFAEIVEEELQQEAALIRSREKPLALIQVRQNAQYNKLRVADYHSFYFIKYIFTKTFGPNKLFTTTF